MKMTSNPHKTLLTICTGLLIVFLISEWDWALNAAVAIGVLGLISEFLAKKIEWLWMKLAWVLSLIIPRILLSAIFYLFLFPVALLAKLFSKRNYLQLKNPEESVWIEEEKVFDAKGMENPW